MGRRPIVLFWGSVAAAVFFLGSLWTVAGRVGSGPHRVANLAVLVIAAMGFLATAFVAGRIALVVGRLQRKTRWKGRTDRRPVRRSGSRVS